MNKRVQDRIKAGLSKYRPVLESARSRDVSESDTVLIIHDMLADIFGWDKYAEVTSEYQIRGTFCDLAVKHGGQVRYLIEAKAIDTTLKEAHVRQALGYASQHGTEWIVLTNGVEWQVRQVKFEQPIHTVVVLSFDLLDTSTSKSELYEKLYTLCRESVKSEAIEAFAARKKVLNKNVLAAILVSDESLNLIKRTLKRMSADVKATPEEIKSILENDVLKRELVESDDAKNARRRVGRAAKRKLRSAKSPEKEEQDPETSEPPVDPAPADECQ